MDVERSNRALRSESHELKDQLDELSNNAKAFERQSAQTINELEQRCEQLSNTLKNLENEIRKGNNLLNDKQQTLRKAEERCEVLEAELKRNAVSKEEIVDVSTLKRELSVKVSDKKNLEHQLQKVNAALKKYEDNSQSLEVVKESKRNLEKRLELMDDMRRQLGETESQLLFLKQEKASWTSFFTQDELKEFSTPSAIAAALSQQRSENALLMERLENTNARDTTREDDLLQHKKQEQELQTQVEQSRKILNRCEKARQRLEKQRDLATKETRLLRDQLKSYDSEETLNMNFDAQKLKRIEELESLLEQYKEQLNDALNSVSLEANAAVAGVEKGQKRKLDEEDEKRVGELSRRNRSLQEGNLVLMQKWLNIELSQSQEIVARRSKELDVSQAKCKQLQENLSNRTRILEFRDNPASREQVVKQDTLDSLQKEVEILRAQVEGGVKGQPQMISIETLHNMRKEARKLEQDISDKDKRMDRLKQVWTSKSSEFREAVYAILGYRLEFLADGRVKILSVFAESGENALIFDGEGKTMQMGGGSGGRFANEFRNLVEFWCHERKEVPCFLAALTLELFERSTRGAAF